MEPPDQFQIIVQHLVKIPALLSCLCQNHGQVEGNHADIKTSHKDRLILLIRRLHTAPLIPRRQKGAAPHGRNHSAVFLVNFRHIPFPGQGKPIGIHGFRRAGNPRFKQLLQFTPRTMQVFII